MVFVTGATGILGRIIVLELLKKGENVRAAKRPTSNLDEVKHSYSYLTEDHQYLFDKIEWIDIDFNDIHSLQSAVDGADEVYHCAAMVSLISSVMTSPMHPSKCFSSTNTATSSHSLRRSWEVNFRQ